MTSYNVHIYREMRLMFEGIEADTPEAAAYIARDRLTSDADDIKDCNGEDLSALVDVAGDEDYRQSLTVDFETERHRKAAPKLLATLELLANQADEDCPSHCRSRHFVDALEEARTAATEAKAAGISPAPGDIDIHMVLAGRRQIADIWSIEDVQTVRSDLTNEQAWEILQHVRRRYDASIGINWDVLRCHSDDIAGDAPKTSDAAEGE